MTSSSRFSIRFHILLVVDAGKSRKNRLSRLRQVRCRLGLLPSLLERSKFFRSALLLHKQLLAGKPTSHGRNRMATSLKLVLGISCTFKNGAVDGVEPKIVLRSGKIQETKSINMTLILRRKGDLDISAIEGQPQSRRGRTRWTVDLI